MNAVSDLLARPFGTLPELLAAYAQTRPEHPALVLGEQVLNFAQLHARVQQVAGALQRDGVMAGQTIVVCAATSLAYVCTFLGAVQAGVTVAPLPPTATPEQLQMLSSNAGAVRAFVDAQTAAAWHGTALPCLSLDEPDWSQWLQGAPQPQPVQRQPQEPFNIIYSSGTTGLPKGIVQPCGMRWVQLQRSTATPDAVTLLPLPMYSNFTLTYLFGAVGMGGTVVLMDKFDAGRYLKLAVQHRATNSVLVPVQFRRIMDHPDFERTDLSALRRRFSAGAPFVAELKAEVLRRWPGELTDFYGMTEGGGRTELHAHLHPTKLHTVGQVSAGNDIRLIDEDGRELQADETGEMGEIVGHSATMMNGYHGLPEATRAAEWFDASGKRFIRTGDVGRFDADGFLVLMDRRKDMLISGGFNVYPSDLEEVLRQHPQVADVAVVGVPSQRWGETPVAFVVPTTAATDREDAVCEWANARLGKAQRLACVQFTDALPRSEVGKVLKRQLRDSFVRAVP